MWLRQLASDDEQVRSEALERLDASICHQGWICPATGYAVPYLIEVIQEPTVQGKARILRLLAAITDADPLDEDEWRPNPEVPEWEVPASIPFVDARAAVEAGVLVYQTLLDAPELSVRQWAAALLMRFSERAPEVWLMLQAVLKHEPTEQGQTNLVLALGNLAQRLPGQQAFFLEQFQTEQQELRQFAAALALTRLAREATPEAAVQVLVRAMLEPSAALEAFQELPCGGPVRKAASWTLFYLGSARLQFLAPLLEEQLRRASSEGESDDFSYAQSLAELLVFIVFGDTPEKGRKRRPVAALTDQQRVTLLLLLEHERVWYSSNLRDLLAGHRLPATREEMAAYLGHKLSP